MVYSYIVYRLTSHHLDVFLCISWLGDFLKFSFNKPYALFISSLSLSAIIAINSELVGFPLLADIVFPNIVLFTSAFPLDQATSIACRMARSILEGVVLNFLAT